MIVPLPRIFLRRFTLTLFFFTIQAQSCFGATLYDRSLSQFQTRAQHASAKEYTFVVLGDSRGGDAIFKRALLLAASFQPLFILHGGDFSDRGSEQETKHFLSIVNETLPQVPLFVVKGNHENPKPFAEKIGPFDFTLSSKRLGLTLVAVDNSGTALKPAELEYLRSQLSKAFGTAFVAMHVPPKTERWTWHTFTEGKDELKRVLAQGRVQGAFFSHVHLYDRAEFGGVPAIITGGAGAPLVRAGFPGDPEYHIVVVKVKDGKASFTKVPIRD